MSNSNATRYGGIVENGLGQQPPMTIIDESEVGPISEWEQASFYKKWSFSVAVDMINEGQRQPLDFHNLLQIPRRDYSSQMVHRLKYYYENSTTFYKVPKLLVALLKAHSFDVWLIAVLTVSEGTCMVVSPLILRYLLEALNPSYPIDQAYTWAALLSGIGFLQVFVHHVLYFHTMRLGWNWKNASTALVHLKLLSLDSAVLQSSGAGTGMMVNLISNDVSRFEEFAIFGMFSWVSLLVLAAVLIELVYILDVPSAFAGVGCSIVQIPLLVYSSQWFAQYRGQTAAATDQRVRQISEVIDGIASVKSFAWETPFFFMLKRLRLNEIKYISKSQALRALNQGIMFATPSIVAFVTFSVYWGNGGTLTIAEVFATLSLLQVLRLVMGQSWTRSMETGAEAFASCYRLERFLDLESMNSNSMPTTVSGGETARAATKESIFDNSHDSDAREMDQGDLYGVYTTTDHAEMETTGIELNLSRDISYNHHISNQDKCIVSIRPTSFYYGTNSSSPVLQNVSFSVHRGELMIVVGPVGCGKSSLLAAILGEINAVPRSDLIVDNPGVDSKGREYRVLSDGCRIAYCAQRPWILAASVKTNVTLAGANVSERSGNFRNPTNINARLYSNAVESCLLVDDMLQWPAYDDTEVGERGISISGGQKARISLARAVYSDADLYVLDDPLSAVDAHVGKGLMNHCIIDALKAKGKAVVLVTHQLQYLSSADKILVLDARGEQVFYGPHEMFQSNPEVMSILDLKQQEIITEANVTLSDPAINRGTGLSKVPSIPKQLEHHGNYPRYDPNYRQSARKSAQLDDDISEGKTTIDKPIEEETTLESQQRIIIQSEDRGVGSIAINVYWKYLQSGGIGQGLLAVMVIAFSQLVLMANQYWLRWWATSTFGPQRSNSYIIVLACLAALCAIVGFLRAWLWFRFCLDASSELHERCLWSVVHCPMRFFVANPTGRILNRFSKDQNSVDEMLPITFFSFMDTAVYCLAAVVLVCVVIPYLTVLIPVLGYVFLHTRRKYIIASREVKRMEAITRSPIYADFSATIEGLMTLRAYKLEKSVTKYFQKQIDENAKAWFTFLMCARYDLPSMCLFATIQLSLLTIPFITTLAYSRWLGVRLDLETAVILAFVSIVSVALRQSIDVGLLGFALVYTMSLSGIFQWAVRQSAEVETQMTAVERISTYSRLPPEEGYATSYKQAILGAPTMLHASIASTSDSSTVEKHEQPSQLVLKDLTVTYREDLSPVLKGLNLTIPQGCKVGICGRTGSGKSSTLLSLLRLNIIVSGDIFLNGRSLLKTDLQTARSLIAMVPQEPHLFSGTIRFNLDPFNMYSDERIWQSLRDAHIYDYIHHDPLGLSAVVEEGGKNFSVGQRQLISLARAILRECEVVLMDEVTASIDYVTDRCIQETIRSSSVLKSATIITVAHRLRTIADSDLIVVVQDGVVAEQGSPGYLLSHGTTNDGDNNGRSIFHQLVSESNEFDDILNIALKRTASN